MALSHARQQLAALAPLAERLNAASDQFTAELKSIEENLTQLKLGLEVTLDTPLIAGHFQQEVDEEDGSVREPYRLNHYLGYGRHGGGWRLVVRTFRDFAPAAEKPAVLVSTTPLLSASRELRAAAVVHLDGLLALLGAEARGALDLLSRVADQM